MAQKRIHLFVSGRVQGVFYRTHIKKLAERMDVKGFVRNLSDGRVEIVGEAEDSIIDKFIVYCQDGPILARIDEVDIRTENPTNKFENFKVS
ncbi:MAG: acylphosphatase [Nanoarchaeota archaeon]|nr:acylphosphatase [Nanoarchaeota archaeon]